MEYHQTLVTIVAAVTGYAAGDYCIFYANAGSGAIDYDSAISTSRDLFGQTSITLTDGVIVPGDWQYGIISYDKRTVPDTQGNPSAAPHRTDSLYVDCEPKPPTAITVNSYDSVASTLNITC